MKEVAGQVVRKEPRIELLRGLGDLPLLSILLRPHWHLLCDAPMEAHFLALGLPPDRLTQALEHGAFLRDDFALPCPPTAVAVIATRRSEEAVAGVMRMRGIEAVPLFASLLPRMLANVDLQLSEDALCEMSSPTQHLAIFANPWSGAEELSREIVRLTGVRIVVPKLAALSILAGAPAALDFDLARWWRLFTHANAANGSIAVQFGWSSFAAFLGQLDPRQRDWLERQVAEFNVVWLRRDPLVLAAAEQAAAAAGPQQVDRAAAVGSILRRRDALVGEEAALYTWFAAIGARVTTLDCAEICADPTGSARRIAEESGIPMPTGRPEIKPLAPPRPSGLRFDRFLEAARAAAAGRG